MRQLAYVAPLVFPVCLFSACSSNRESLTVEPRSLDFGEIAYPAQKAISVPITLRNAGNSDIDITGFAASCNCTSLRPARVHLSPQSEEVIELSIELDSAGMSASSEPVVSVAVKVLPISRGEYLRPFFVRGTVRRFASFSRDAIAFGTCTASVPVEPIVVVARVMAHDDQLTAAGSDGLEVRTTRSASATGFYDLQIAFRPQNVVSPVSYEGAVIVSCVGSRENRVVGLLPVSAKMTPDIRVAPQSVALGFMRGKSNFKLRATSRSGRAWSYVGIRRSGAATISALGEDKRGADFTIDCALEVDRRGPAGPIVEGEFDVTFEDDAGQLAVLPVSWSGIRIDAGKAW